MLGTPPPFFFWNLIEFFRCFLRISKNLMRKSFLTWFYRQSFFQADIIWEKLTFLIIFGISVSLESRGQSFILWLSPFFLVIKKSKAFAFFFFPHLFFYFLTEIAIVNSAPWILDNKLTISEVMLLGCVLSATDTVAALSLVKEN